MSASQVWEYFSKVSASATNPKARCNICHLEMVVKDGSTTSLRRHVQNKHDIKLGNKRSSDKDAPEQPTLKVFLASNAKLHKDSQRYKNITQNVANMIVKDLQPLSFIEDEGFQKLLHVLEPRYTLPSRATFRNAILPQMYKEVAAKLKTIIQQTNTYSITTDGWTSRNTDSFVTYTLHVVDTEFIMHSYVLGTYKFKTEHTADHLRSHIVKTFKDWGIIPGADVTLTNVAEVAESGDEEQEESETENNPEYDDDQDYLEDTYQDIDINPNLDLDIPADILKNIIITTDNASNISKAVNDSGIQHIRCFAHTVNLAVMKGVNSLSSQIARVRKIVSYFHRSSIGSAKLKVMDNNYLFISDLR